MSSQIVVTSAVLPPITIDLAGSGGSGKPSLLLALLKPRVQVYGPADGPAFVDEAPAGNPGVTWPVYTVGGLVLVTLLFIFAVRGVMK